MVMVMENLVMEKLVMELYGRVATLEDANRELLERIEKLEEYQEGTPDYLGEGTLKITKSVSRNYVMETLKKYNPKFVISKGNRASGADILLKDEKKASTLKVNFYHSKSFEESFPRGWHTVKKEDLDNVEIRFYVFLVVHDGKYYTWLFSREELIYICKEKEIDANNVYHFYFTIKDGKNYEARENELDMQPYFEKWDKPNSLIAK